MINIAIVGVGDWGKNLVRNFTQLPEVNLKYACDLDLERLKYVQHHYPQVKVTRELPEVLKDREIDAVVVATTARTHYQVARESLRAQKHTYVEKPLAFCVSEAKELVELARQNQRILMVGHLMRYHPAIVKLKELIDAQEIGEIYYIYSQRINLGKIRQDENALWSFAPHDLSVILYLLQEEPTEVTARGESYLQNNIEDVVFVNLRLGHNRMANIHLSWLDPHKIRKITVVGSRKMVVFDDMEPTEKIRIYDKGVRRSLGYETYAEYLSLRFGDVTIPYLKLTEPLKNECLHFVECIKQRRNPDSDGSEGVKVVRILEAAQKSLQQGGVPVRL